MTTRRSSVISRTAQAGPSRVLPESLTPPYGIWSARKVGASLTVTPPNSSAAAARVAVCEGAGEDAGLEPVARAVGERERLVQGVVGLERADGTEGLVAGEVRVGCGPLDHGGSQEVAVELAAGEHRGAAGARLLDPGDDTVALGGGDQRADVGVLVGSGRRP